MSGLLYLIPIAVILGLIGLAAFLWALKSGQFDDLDGAAERVLFDEDAARDDTDNRPLSGEPLRPLGNDTDTDTPAKSPADQDDRVPPPPRRL